MSLENTSSSSLQEKVPPHQAAEAPGSADWEEDLRAYRLLQEVLWGYFDMTERIRVGQSRAVQVDDLIREGVLRVSFGV